MNDDIRLMLDVQTQALLQITSAIETARTLDELLLLSLSESARLLDVPRSGIALVHDDNTLVQLVNIYPPRVSLPPPRQVHELGSLTRVITERQAVQVQDVHNEDLPPGLREIVDSEDYRSLLVVPLVAQDRVIGMLGVGTLGTQRTFSEHDIALLRILTGPLAASISAFHTTEAARRRSAEIATLNDIAATVTSSLDTREIYHLVVRQLNAYFNVDAGSLLMRDDETGDLEFVMTLETGEEKLTGVRVPCGRGVVGHVAETQTYEIVPDVQNDPRYYSKISEDMGYETRSILCVPMIVKGRTLGVIELLNKLDGDFTDEDAERLTRMAATISVALENARLFQQVMTGRDRFEAILNSTNDGILMADMRGYVVTANPMAARLFNRSKEALINERVGSLLSDLRTNALQVSAPSWLNDNTPNGIPDVIELELGSPFHSYIRHFSLPVHDANHAEIGQLLLFQDVSKERELAQLREDYTGMLVHDLRAPLTAIMSGITMVRRGLGGPVSDQQNELLNIAFNSSQTMLEMVNTLLDISKMEQGRMALTMRPTTPYDVADITFDRLRASAQSHEITLEALVPADLPDFEADRETLVRVLQNLLDNAIKFSPSGATVTLGVAHMRHDGAMLQQIAPPPATTLPITLPDLSAQDWIVFWVQDRGSGIPAQYHERIFEKFGQVRNGKVRGTGLGLTFCKLATEAHGGCIWLESVEGQGSIFALALPLTQQPVEAAA